MSPFDKWKDSVKHNFFEVVISSSYQSGTRERIFTPWVYWVIYFTSGPHTPWWDAFKPGGLNCCCSTYAPNTKHVLLFCVSPLYIHTQFMASFLGKTPYKIVLCKTTNSWSTYCVFQNVQLEYRFYFSGRYSKLLKALLYYQCKVG